MKVFLMPLTPGFQKGWTLIEILLVVALIAVLTAIALPAYREYTKQQVVLLAKSQLVSFAATAHALCQKKNGCSLVYAQDIFQNTSNTAYTFSFSPGVGQFEFLLTAMPSLANTDYVTLTVDSYGLGKQYIGGIVGGNFSSW